MRKLRMAVVGAGRLGGFHAQKLAQMQDVDLLAVVDPVPAQRNRVATECRTRPLADPSEIVVTEPVMAMAFGSGLEFVPRGEEELRGLPGRWRLWSVADGT